MVNAGTKAIDTYTVRGFASVIDIWFMCFRTFGTIIIIIIKDSEFEELKCARKVSLIFGKMMKKISNLISIEYRQNA